MFLSRARSYRRSLLLSCALLVSFRPAPSGNPVPQAEPATFESTPVAAHGAGPWRRTQKPLHQVVACFGLVLGVTGIFLAFVTGPVIPVVTWAVASLALQVCGG